MTRLIRTAGVLLAIAVLTAIAGQIAGFAQAPVQPIGAGPVFPPAIPDCLAFGEARTAVHSGTGMLRFIGTDSGRPIVNPRRGNAATPESAALGYLSACGTLFGLRDAGTELAVTRSTQNDGGHRAVRLQQRHQGIPVFGGELIVQLDNNNDVLSVAGETAPLLTVNVAPALAAAAAARVARDLVASTYSIPPGTLTTSAPELWVYAPALITPRPARPALVWRLEVVHQEVPPVRELVLVDAQRGSVALNFNQIETARNRMTYNLANTTTLPGTLVCNEANPSCSGGDSDAIAAHDYAGDTYDYYFSNFGRDSLNNAGMTLTSSVHFGPVGYQNAFWNGQQMAYGDGFSQADDVVGHELTHGVTTFTSNLYYYYQSGAINESFSDVFGEFIDQGNGSGTDTPGVKWLLGEDVPGGGAIRNMQNPPAYGNPDKMTSPLYYTGPNDNGGVHSNSGINNKAAFLIVDGGTFNGQTVTGIGLAKAGRIYYEVETAFLTSGSDYADLHDALFQACTNLIGTLGITSGDCQQVRNATLAVEMHLQPVAGFNPDAPLCSPGQIPVNAFFDGLEVSSANFVPMTLVGTPRWSRASFYAKSGRFSLFGDDFPEAVADSSMALATGVVIPANAFLHFAHAFSFQLPDRDGGVVEYSTDGGAIWNDAGPLIDANGYRGAIAAGFGNPLAGRSGFIGTSHGYMSTRANLSSLAGQTVKFRWRLGIDTAGYAELGWALDDVRVYTCTGAALTSVTPNSAPQGRANLSVAIVGQDTHFVQGVTTGNFGAGITVNSVTVANATHLTANISLAPTAPMGVRDVSFTTGGEQAVGLNAFTVTQGPQLAAITPNRGQPGQLNLGVAITGLLTSFVPGQTTVSFGAGITTISTTVADATHATAVISIDGAAAVGPRAVTVTTGAEVVVAPAGFLVRTLLPATQVYAYVLGRRYLPSQSPPPGTPPANGEQTVNVINTATNTTVATIQAGMGCWCVGPDGLAVHPDGTRVYVANELENTVTVIDTLTNSAIATVPVGVGPIAVAVHPNGTRAYIVNDQSTSVTVLDTASHATLATIPLGVGVVQARGAAISPDGNRLYVTTYGAGSVKVIDTTTNSVIAMVPTGNIALGLDSTPDGSKLYVATFPFNGSGNPPRVSVISTATNALLGNVSGITASPMDVTAAPDGTRAYVIQSGTQSIAGYIGIVSTSTDAVTGTIGLSGSAAEFTPDGTRAYVTTNGSVAVVNAQTNALLTSVPFTYAANGGSMSVAMGPAALRTLSLSGNLAFRARRVGTTSYGTLFISNAGNTPLTVNSVTYPAGFSGATGPFVIPPAGSQSAIVSFTPPAPGTYSGEIVVNSNQNGAAPNRIAVSGKGVIQATSGDFDPDIKSDFGVFRPSTGFWHIRNTVGAVTTVPWGGPGDIPVARDYNADGAVDIAVFRPSTGFWYVRGIMTVPWGGSGDIPVPADYLGDGSADIAVYRPSTGVWYIRGIATLAFGAPGDIPVPGDYDGDGAADIAVYRPSTGLWYILNNPSSPIGWGGAAGDLPVPADYDGDGKTDIAIFRDGTWHVRGLLSVGFGGAGDIPVPSDFDGNGTADIAIFRPSTGMWYVRGFAAILWGWIGDVPVQK